MQEIKFEAGLRSGLCFRLIVGVLIITVHPLLVDKPCPRVDKPCPRTKKVRRAVVQLSGGCVLSGQID